MTQPRETVEIHTDGACSPNPGVGGWAAILVSPRRKTEKVLTGAERQTTNNRMELTAAVRALQALKRPCAVRLTTDSEYLKNAFTNGWLAKWQRNGWKTSQRKPVLNQDLWQELLAAAEPHDVQWLWVRGHSEHPLNERCDRLAVEARRKMDAR